MKIIARHKWLTGCTITESIDEETNTRRFTATVRGWRNFKIAEGKIGQDFTAQDVMDKVKAIRDRIDAGDETVFA